MGIDRMHRCGGKICFMYNELQSSPVELSVLRKLITYTKDKVVQNSVVQDTSQVWSWIVLSQEKKKSTL